MASNKVFFCRACWKREISAVNWEWRLHLLPLMNFALIGELLSQVTTDLAISISSFFIDVDINTGWMFVQPTYDNGDETDFWCDTFTMVPKSIVSKTRHPLAYGNCACTEPNLIVISDGATSFLSNVNYLSFDYFVCKWWLINKRRFRDLFWYIFIKLCVQYANNKNLKIN